ncbi:MAG: hypothetical protein P4L35_07495 [Ignavibacteriaceae bacterium]|nr:hypothetical protein [Ignavibacteriaceae bacterium]
MNNRYFILSALLIIGLFFNSCKEPVSSPQTPNPSVTVTSPKNGDTLIVGSVDTVKWTSNSSSNVKIEFSIDNGANWIILSDNVPNNGTYVWFPVPNTISNQGKIRITTDDTLANAVSTGFFYVIKSTVKLLTLTKPVGGEVLYVNDSFRVEWVSSNITSIRIELSIDNGSTWNSVVPTYPADSSHYLWNPIPSSPSTQCILRITDVSDATITDKSKSVFSIVYPQSIKVLSPNGGEIWNANSSQAITWYSSSVNNVKIEYTIDNGNNWNIITNSTPSVGYYLWSAIPNLPSSNGRIRISDALDGYPSDVSDSVFTISPLPALKIISPNGGENWMSGSSQTIRWNSLGKIIIGGKSNLKLKSSPYFPLSITNIKIEYTTNNGANWNSITPSTPNNGSFLWAPVPSQNSSLCRVKISDADQGVPFAVSDSSFVIYNTVPKHISVISPNGGELWQAGTTQVINWSSTGVTAVNIDFTINNGINWNPIIANTPSTGYYSWTQIPNSPSANCSIRITDVSDSTVTVKSNSVFSIVSSQEIRVISPNGGESWNANSSQPITWFSSSVNNVKIEYTIDNGSNWTTITNSTSSVGYYLWNAVPNIPSSNARIRISEASTGYPSDVSDNVFTISPQPALKIISPDGGENWMSGSSQTIRWNALGKSRGAGSIPIKKSPYFPLSITNIKIEYTINNGANWNTITPSTPNNGSYLWNPVPSQNSSLCRVKISDADLGAPFAISDSTFVIYNTVHKDITVKSPNGGEIWQAGTTQVINWISTNVTAVNIDYTINNGINWNPVVANIPSTGYYSWTQIPNTPSTNCSIRITDVSDSTVTVKSNSVFSIVSSQEIRVIIPNGGENWNTNSSQPITWFSSSINNVKIEYTIDNGSNWTTITSSTSSVGYYLWNTVPNVPSTNARIRISEATTGYPSDVSDNVFTISPQPALKIISPNGGENWMSGSSQTIRWNSLGKSRGGTSLPILKTSPYFPKSISNIKIEYTTNDGANWNSIAQSTPNNGSYLWSPVPSQNSSLCRVKISDADLGVPYAISDSTFVIYNNVPREITVKSPNGGEIWQAGTTQVINWSSTNVTSVNIDYTINNGINWNPVVANIPSTGYYSWTQIPNTPSTNCRIRISDAVNGTPVNQSTSTFTIAPPTEITVAFPNGGESFIPGSNMNIAWTSTNVTNVKIEFTTDNGADWNLIIASTPSIGQYVWQNIPSINSSLCRIKISNADGTGQPFDISNNNFTITNIKVLRWVFPNGSPYPTENLSTDTTITWYSSGIVNVNIEYTIDNGLTWNPVVSNLHSSGAYRWHVPLNPPTSLARMRVTDSSDPTVTDMSDTTFNINVDISPSSPIKLLTPIGNKTFSASSGMNISWKGISAISNVKIEYSADNGKSWNSIAENIHNAGKQVNNYLWNGIPQNIKGNILIRLSDSNGRYSDKSGKILIK